MPAKKQRSERKPKPSGQVVGRRLNRFVEPSCPSCGVPYVDHLGLVGTCAKLRKAVAVLRTIADPNAELHQDGRSIDRTYEDIAREVLIEIGEFNPTAHGRAVARTVQPIVGHSELGAE